MTSSHSDECSVSSQALGVDKRAVAYNRHGATFHSGSSDDTHTTRPALDTLEELIWLRGYESGVIDMRADRNQIIQELIEKAEAEAKDLANRSGMPLEHTWQAQVAWWLKSQMKGEE